MPANGFALASAKTGQDGRFPPPPPNKKPPLRWFVIWGFVVISTRVHAGRGQGFVKQCLTLTKRASDVSRAPAYEPILAASTK